MSAKLQIANCLVWCRNVSVIAVISQRGITGHIIDYLVHKLLGRAVQSVVSHVHHFFFGYGLVQITLRLSPLNFTLIKYRVEVKFCRWQLIFYQTHQHSHLSLLISLQGNISSPAGYSKLTAWYRYYNEG